MCNFNIINPKLDIKQNKIERLINFIFIHFKHSIRSRTFS